MIWMISWPDGIEDSPRKVGFPPFVEEAKGARLIDVDGKEYVDFSLGDSGATFGHSPKPVVDAVTRQIRRGITMLLPTEDSIWVGEELSRRFRLAYWSIVMTATDANRFAIRLAREVTKRETILIFNWCYHGTVDEALAHLEEGVVVPHEFCVGQLAHSVSTTKVVEFNDVEALEAALSPQDVACVLCEPAITGRPGIVLPEPGYHEKLRALTRRFGTLLVIDETHTICGGPGGYTAAHNLEPDILTLGKPIAGGVPAAVYGISQEVANKAYGLEKPLPYGLGGTLSGNALAVAAMRATLEHVMTKEAYNKMIPLAERYAQGIDGIIKNEGLPWNVIRLGARVEFSFRPTPAKNGAEGVAFRDVELSALIQLFALNRGIMLTPFHNMALMSPYTTERDVDLLIEVFRKCVKELIG